MNRVSGTGISDVASTAVSRAGKHMLRVETGLKPAPPSPEHRLLMTFRFEGDEGPPADGDIGIPLRKLGADSGAERWWYRGDVEHDHVGPIKISGCDEYHVLSIDVPPEACADIQQATREAYERLFSTLSDRPGFKFVRLWNYLDDINAGEGDLERYRQFSVGRAEAFTGRRIVDESAPAGTAIGTPRGSGLQIIGLASRRQLDPVENPQQMSAFNYPRQYGPKSPKFSRSGIVSAPCSLLFFVSGTAAVVGHESAAPFETATQVGITAENLASLTGAVADRFATPAENLLDSSSHLRIYMRDAADYDEVKAAIMSVLPIPASQIVFLEGDICRRELMVEVEACTVIDQGP